MTRTSVFPVSASLGSQSVVSDSAELLSSPQSSEENPSPLRTPVGVAEEDTGQTQSSESEYIGPDEGNKDAVFSMLRDPAFIMACDNPTEVDTEFLKDAIARAKKTLNAFLLQECARRVDAGLYVRMEGYKPGETFTTTTGGRQMESYHLDGKQALKVDYPASEYDYLYKLNDSIDALDRELASRAVKR